MKEINIIKMYNRIATENNDESVRVITDKFIYCLENMIGGYSHIKTSNGLISFTLDTPRGDTISASFTKPLKLHPTPNVMTIIVNDTTYDIDVAEVNVLLFANALMDGDLECITGRLIALQCIQLILSNDTCGMWDKLLEVKNLTLANKIELHVSDTKRSISFETNAAHTKAFFHYSIEGVDIALPLELKDGIKCLSEIRKVLSNKYDYIL